ncbi:hypothetical protein ABMA27_013636 [Loxostege sticticalis]|uniref:Uncharacterized protein n=1 Tax=Loxostege sticticalis TaxID=481309 RepID=A0ABR3IG13_LOXSC
MTSVSLTQEQFQQLLTVVKKEERKGSFSSCTARFKGDSNNEVETFLAAVSVYKKIENIDDENALTGLPLLLTDDALVWWLGIKNQVKTWADFESRLRNAFAPKTMSYILYQQIIQEKQDKNTLTEIFISKKRALIAKLSGPAPTEQQQIDMVYGQIRYEIRKKLVRDTLTDFDDMLEKVREIERNLAEKGLGNSENLTEKSEKPMKSKIRCSYCRVLGHSIDVCRKKARLEQIKNSKQTDTAVKNNQSVSEKPIVSCYGCGEPNTVRSRCPNCNKKAETTDLSFCFVQSNIDARQRPTVPVSIDGIKGMAYVDSCAKTSIASYKLYHELKTKGYSFKKESMTLTLADGTTKNQLASTFKAAVTLFGKRILTSFIALPEAQNTRTLLGVGFIQDAGLVLNLPQLTCHFVEDPSKSFDLTNEEAVVSRNHISAYSPNFSHSSDPTSQAPTSQTTMVPRQPDDSKAKIAIGSHVVNAAMEATTPPHSENPVMMGSASEYFYQTPPCKRKCELFDGYSPVLDALFKDAQEAINNDDLDVSFGELDYEHLFPSTSILSLEVNVDASNYTIGAVLVQGEGEQEHPPIGLYHSSALRPYLNSDNSNEVPSPVRPIRKRGRPKNVKQNSSHNSCSTSTVLSSKEIIRPRGRPPKTAN